MPNTDYTSYTKTTWQDGDQITTNKLMNIENGIAALSTQVEEALGSTYNSLNERMDEGLLNTDGDVLFKGDLQIQKEHPALYFLEEEGDKLLGGFFQNTVNGENRIALAQCFPNGGQELFWLPSPTDHSVDISYALLTSKNPVTIAQGGTGATNASDARENLGISSLIDNDGYENATWLDAADTYVSGSTRTLVFYRRGNMILFRTNIQLLATTMSATTLGTIPVGFRPTTTIYNSGALANTTNTFYLAFASNGNISIGHYGSTAATGNIRITGCYPL